MKRKKKRLNVPCPTLLSDRCLGTLNSPAIQNIFYFILPFNSFTMAEQTTQFSPWSSKTPFSKKNLILSPLVMK